MPIRCPVCLSTNTYTYVTRSKDYNEACKEFDIAEVSGNVKYLDYVLRRHKCRDCGITFPTIETYYKKIDIVDYSRNAMNVTNIWKNDSILDNSMGEKEKK